MVTIECCLTTKYFRSIGISSKTISSNSETPHLLPTYASCKEGCGMDLFVFLKIVKIAVSMYKN
jgi:hypothetical protein